MVICYTCDGTLAEAYAVEVKLRRAVSLAKSVRAHAAVLLNAAPTGSPAEAKLSEVGSSADAAISLANQVLAYCDSGSQGPYVAFGDLLAAFRKTVGFCRLCAARGVALESTDGLRCPGSPWPIDLVVGSMYAAASNGILSIDDAYRIDPLAFAGTDN